MRRVNIQVFLAGVIVFTDNINAVRQQLSQLPQSLANKVDNVGLLTDNNDSPNDHVTWRLAMYDHNVYIFQQPVVAMICLDSTVLVKPLEENEDI